MPNIFLMLPTTPEVGRTHQESKISQWTQLRRKMKQKKDDNTIKTTGEHHENNMNGGTSLRQRTIQDNSIDYEEVPS